MKRKQIFALALMATAFATGCSKSNEQLPETIAKAEASEARAGVVISVPATIRVAAGKTFDGHNDIYKATSALGDGSQDEGQKPVFRLEKGAKLINVRIAFPGCDGVHCYGDNLISNVTWEDVGEDALTMKAGGNITIDNCRAYFATDKVFMLSSAGKFTLKNSTIKTFGKIMRQIGGDTKNTCEIIIDNCTFDITGQKPTCLVQSDSPTTTLRYRGIKTALASDKWWRFPNVGSQVKPF